VSTKSIFFFQKRNNLLAVFFLVFGTSIFMIPSANADIANTSVICANPAGEQRTFQIGWDNSNQFFADKGYIPAFYCTGGYALPYNIYVSDTLNGGALGYYNGVITDPSSPTPSEPTPSPSPSETVTATPEPTPSESATPTPSPSSSPEPSPTPSPTPEPSPSASSAQETQTSQTETQTVTPAPTDTSTVPSDTSTVLSDTATIVAPVDGSTATSQPEPVVPTPPVVPVVVPEPVEEPVVVPEEEEPLPEPEVTEEVAPEEAPEPITEPKEEVEEEVIPEPEPEPEVVPEVVPVEELEEETVVLDNGVVLTQEQAVAIALLQDPAALLQELFTDPTAALAALSQVGADMSPEVREESEKVIIAAVIAGNIATQAAASAGAVAALRRKP
jgi:hypothetical protein